MLQPKRTDIDAGLRLIANAFGSCTDTPEVNALLSLATDLVKYVEDVCFGAGTAVGDEVQRVELARLALAVDQR
ncbi:hypothetical protein CRT60_01135 [Azospirillum palustre]|uniref:Uncharacterized protein n=1 Tax=Azospirillum palustre TaxID=2044885 RepID=A0A2B8BKE6_9PROT|nr:hypothetical protein CRT60_01135 [Azospirillum palustre]